MPQDEPTNEQLREWLKYIPALKSRSLDARLHDAFDGFEATIRALLAARKELSRGKELAPENPEESEIIRLRGIIVERGKTEVDGWKATVSYQNSQIDALNLKIESALILLGEGRVQEAITELNKNKEKSDEFPRI